MAKRYFKIEGIIEVEDSDLARSLKIDLLDSLSDEVLNNNSFEWNFGGGIKEVDSNGKDLIK